MTWFQTQLRAWIALAFLFVFLPVPSCAAGPSRPSGVLRLARIVDPTTLDGTLMQLAEDFLLFPLLHLPLLDVTNGTVLVPGAAQSWNASSDQRVFTLQLRPGVKFSNGRAVVAEDYVYAMERMLDPANAALLQGYLLGVLGAKEFVAGQASHVAGLRALSPETLVVELGQGNPVFSYMLAFIAAVPREEVERRGRSYSVRPVGSGPYAVQQWIRGARLRLARNPHYHGPEPAHCDGVDLLIGGDETTHLMMFERGELEIANINLAGIPFPSFRRLAQDPRWRGLIERETLFQSEFITLNTEIPPLDNVLVRRAINHALDRDRRLRVALGYKTHAEGVIPPVMPGFNARLRGYNHSPDRARELLRESGLALPLRTQLWHGTEEETRVRAQGFQWDLQQVGIEIDLKAVAIGELMQAAGTRGKVPMCMMSWGVTIPDPSDIIGMTLDGRLRTNAATMNMAFYDNPEVNRLLDQAAPEVDLPRRFALYQRAEELIVRDAPWVFLGHGNLYALRQPWLKGPLLEPLWNYRFDRIWMER